MNPAISLWDKTRSFWDIKNSLSHEGGSEWAKWASEWTSEHSGGRKWSKRFGASLPYILITPPIANLLSLKFSCSTLYHMWTCPQSHPTCESTLTKFRLLITITHVNPLSTNFVSPSTYHMSIHSQKNCAASYLSHLNLALMLVTPPYVNIPSTNFGCSTLHHLWIYPQ